MCNNQTLDYSEDIHILCSLDGMAPSPSKERNSVYDISRLVYTTWQRNRIENSKLNEIDGISSPKRAFHRLCSSNRVWLVLCFPQKSPRFSHYFRRKRGKDDMDRVVLLATRKRGRVHRSAGLHLYVVPSRCYRF